MDKKTIALFTEKLAAHGGDAKAVSAVTSDMSKSYLPAIEENFPNAVSIIDKFHVKKVLMYALDRVRKEEQRVADSKVELFRRRRLFMVLKVRLTDAQAEKLNSLSKLYPKTGRAYSIVAALDCCYAWHSLIQRECRFLHRLQAKTAQVLSARRCPAVSDIPPVGGRITINFLKLFHAIEKLPLFTINLVL